MSLHIYFENAQDKFPVRYDLKILVRNAILATLEYEKVDEPCEVSVTFTDNEGIRAINLDMRGLDSATDVLSFPMFDLMEEELPEEDWADPESGLVPLGDMCISLERAAAQAEEFGHSVEREMAYLTVHSILHLLGYDHLDEGEMKRQMRAREEEIMKQLKLER